MRVQFFVFCAMTCLSGLALAESVETSVRPESRPNEDAVTAEQTAKLTSKIRPNARPNVIKKERAVTPEAILAATSNAGFKRWISAF